MERRAHPKHAHAQRSTHLSGRELSLLIEWNFARTDRRLGSNVANEAIGNHSVTDDRVPGHQETSQAHVQGQRHHQRIVAADGAVQCVGATRERNGIAHE